MPTPKQLFSNNIGAPFRTYPDFMPSACIDVEAVADGEELPLRSCVVWICDGQPAPENEVRCQAAVGVRAVVSIPVGSLSQT